MIGRMILTYPDAARRTGTFLLLALITLTIYSLGVSPAWIGLVLPTSSEWLAANPALGRLVSAVMIAVIAALNWKALRQLPRPWQVVGVWLELFALLMLFFYSFNLSFAFIAKKISFLISQGVVTTLYISVISIAVATVIALVGAIAKLSKNGVIYGLATFYTSLFRGLPLLMQIYIIYLGLPQVGYVISAVPAGILALSLCYGAYMTEIFRAGIESIPRGQTEGATALGLNPSQTMGLVILPQAMRVIIPPTGNNFINMIKGTSMASVIAFLELIHAANNISSRNLEIMETLFAAAAWYLVMVSLASIGQHYLERAYGPR